jgi:hypothetical protein
MEITPSQNRRDMSKKKEEPRYIYKKDPELGKAGFAVFEHAKNLEAELLKKYPEPQHRVRTRLRARTNTWDVVVKVRTEVKEPAQLTPKQIRDAKDQEFIAHHALTGE